MKPIKFNVIKRQKRKSLFYKYSVQVYVLDNNGNHYNYAGIGRYCNTRKEVRDYERVCRNALGGIATLEKK
jgi:hypothetical protein